jgi:hypothetical protein
MAREVIPIPSRRMADVTSISFRIERTMTATPMAKGIAFRMIRTISPSLVAGDRDF